MNQSLGNSAAHAQYDFVSLKLILISTFILTGKSGVWRKNKACKNV
jgi:hypothetical protein